jgi:MFS family permease
LACEKCSPRWIVGSATFTAVASRMAMPERTKALGVWSAIAAGGGAFGLLLGGILTDALSWRWVFFVNVPVGIATVVLSARLVPESRAPERAAGFDVAGAVSVTAGLVALVYAIVKPQAFGWGSPRTLGLGAVAPVLLAAFIAIERRAPSPLVRLTIFRARWPPASSCC